jgi:hypothetical protein
MKLPKLSYPKKQFFIYYLLLILIFIILISTSIYFFHKGWQNPPINPISVVLIVGAIIGIIFLYITKFSIKQLLKIEDFLLEKIRIAKLGIMGEKIARSEVEKAFISVPNLKIYTNFTIPGYKFDIDLIVTTTTIYLFLKLKTHFKNYISAKIKL